MTIGDRTPECPQCGQPGTPIAYGYPSEEMWNAAESGQVVLGGCEVWAGMPTWQCPQGHRWSDGAPRVDGLATVTFGRPRDDDERSQSQVDG